MEGEALLISDWKRIEPRTLSLDFLCSVFDTCPTTNREQGPRGDSVPSVMDKVMNWARGNAAGGGDLNIETDRGNE